MLLNPHSNIFSIRLFNEVKTRRVWPGNRRRADGAGSFTFEDAASDLVSVAQ